MIKKVIIGALAALGLFFLLTTISFNFIPHCYVNDVSVIYSPDEKHFANYSVRKCENGAPKVEVWIGETEDNASMALAFSSLATTNSPLKVTWLNNYDLKIQYPKALKPDSKNERLLDLIISYRAIEGQ